MIRILPIFKGYTVDARLKQFRKHIGDHDFEFLEFDSDKGDRILSQYIKTLDPDSEEFNEIARAIC
jgi:hypothetical protein